jgi:hypothetical protein
MKPASLLSPVWRSGRDDTPTGICGQTTTPALSGNAGARSDRAGEASGEEGLREIRR